MFTVLASGSWSPGRVRTTWTQVSSRPRTPEIEALIEAAWAEASARPGIHLFDGPMCRLESFEASDRELVLHLSPTSYKPFMGTNLSNPDVASRFGRRAMANPVGMSAALVTGDGFLLLGQRSATVAYYPDRVHPFAGALEPKDAGDPFAGIRRELAEELSIANQEVTTMTCLGLIEDATLLQPELVFAVTTPLTRPEIERRMDHTEHRAVYPIPATRAAVEQVLAMPDRLTPVAAGTLTLWMQRLYVSRAGS